MFCLALVNGHLSLYVLTSATSNTSSETTVNVADGTLYQIELVVTASQVMFIGIKRTVLVLLFFILT